MPRLVTSFAILIALTLALTTLSTAQTPIRKIDAGTISLDGPPGTDAVHPVSTATPPDILLLDHHFNLASPNDFVCDDEGWTGHDITGQDGLYFHIDDFFLITPGVHGLLVPISGSQSLWCGARPSTAGPLCSYGCLPGYGNDWDQGWCTKNCLAVGTGLSVSFDIAWDTEPGYDYMELDFDDGCGGNWQKFAGGIFTYDGTGTASATHNIPDVDHGPSVRIRLRVVSDGAYSDEDCLLDTDGAVVVDNLRVDDSGGTVLPVEDFEGESPGDLASNDWEACLPSGYGDYSCLFPGSTALQQVSPLDRNASCMWGFFCASVDYYSCDGFPAQQVVPYENARGEYINNEIWSPWIAFTGPTNATTHMKFDVYRDLTLDALVFYDWRVRSRATVGGCPDEWRTDNYVYYGGRDWRRQQVDLDPFLPYGGATAEMQVALGVIDMCKYWCGVGGWTGTCHSNSPMFDNVYVYRSNTQSWVVEDTDLFQDAFPEDGTTTGTVRCDTPTGDAASVLVTEPAVGIDDLIPGNPLSGPAVFCHVHNLPGKSGSAVSGGIDWPEVPSMSTADWTVIQMAPGATLNQYTVDLADNLYTPGDTVEFYFSARDKTPHTSYFSHLIGRTDVEAEAQATPMEMTCLPAGGAAAHGILYVDYYDGYGAEPYFMQAFDALDITPHVDRFDRRASSSGFANSLSDQVAALAQIQGYGAIVWNSGSFETGSFATGDYKLLFDYLNLTPGSNGLFLSGDNIATELFNSGDTWAVNLRSIFLNYSVTNSNHRDAGEMVSPLVIGEPLSYFDDVPGPDTLIAYGSDPALNSFDVISPSGSAVLEMSYSGNSSNGAVISQALIGGGGYQARTLLSGFSFHHIRDERPKGAYGAMDRWDFMRKALLCLNILADQPVTAPERPAFAYRLVQNYPNPFNPSTTIEYSLREEGRVRVAVYDVAGRRVRLLVDEVQPATGHMYSVTWDGTNDSGQHVASGVYFYRMESGTFRQTRKMVMLK